MQNATSAIRHLEATFTRTQISYMIHEGLSYAKICYLMEQC